VSPAFEALFWGLVGGGALVLGAAIGYLVQVPGRDCNWRPADNDYRYHDSRGFRRNAQLGRIDRCPGVSGFICTIGKRLACFMAAPLRKNTSGFSL
jgi:hypothetical protein